MAAPPEGQASAAESPIRVLFADDSASIRTLARFALSARHGFLVVGEAADGAAAVDLFDEHQPDCVVLDIEMPGVGGFGALAEMRRRGVTVPVVMLSGSTDPETRTRALAEGASAYLSKDEMTLLAETIRRGTGAATGGAPLALGESPNALPDTPDAPDGHADEITGRACVSSTNAERVAAAER